MPENRPPAVEPAKTRGRKPKPTAEEPIEKQLWKAADKLRKNIDAAEYKHIVLGLVFPGGPKRFERTAGAAIVRSGEAQRGKDTGATYPAERQRSMAAREQALRGGPVRGNRRRSEVFRATRLYISDAFVELHTKLLAEKDSGADPEDKDEYKAENVFFVPPGAWWPTRGTCSASATSWWATSTGCRPWGARTSRGSRPIRSARSPRRNGTCSSTSTSTITCGSSGCEPGASPPERAKEPIRYDGLAVSGVACRIVQEEEEPRYGGRTWLGRGR